MQPEVGVYPKGDDPNIIHHEQIQAGTPMPQGPHGPIIAKPKPTSFPVTQTPRAPQIMQTIEPLPGLNFSPMTRKVSGSPVQGSHQLPGPGNYNPPIEKAPGALPGLPGSGQQLIKHFLMHAKEQEEHELKKKQEQKIQDEIIRQHLINANMAMIQQHVLQQKHQQQQQQLHQQQQEQLHQQQQEQQRQQQIHQHLQQIHKQQQQQQKQQHPTPDPTYLPTNVLQHRNNAPPSIRRQDLLSEVLPSAAAGALASGLTPISIFSNLLNAYATLDSKHDITGTNFINV